MWALVPIKQLERAKSRLAPALDPRQRQRLVRAMFLDVLTTLRQVDRLDGIAVVTSDDGLATSASDLGATVLREPEPGDDEAGSHLNRALESARTRLASQLRDGLLVVPADVPLLGRAEIEELLDLADEHRAVVVIAPDRSEDGTNALVLRPATAIPFLFGPGSAEAHTQAARERGIPVRKLRSRGVALDVDEPADLDLLRRRAADGTQNETRDLIRAWRATGDELVSLRSEGAGA